MLTCLKKNTSGYSRISKPNLELYTCGDILLIFSLTLSSHEDKLSAAYCITHYLIMPVQMSHLSACSIFAELSSAYLLFSSSLTFDPKGMCSGLLYVSY